MSSALLKVAGAVLILASACGKTNPCKSGTVLVTIAFDDVTKVADSLDVTVTIFDAGSSTGASKSGNRSRHPGAATGTIQVDFPNGFPAGKTIDVAFVAKESGAPIGGGHAMKGPLAEGCDVLDVAITGAATDAGTTGAAGNPATPDGSTGGTSGSTGAGGRLADSGSDGCSNACVEGRTACVAGGVATCARASNGCLAYAAPVACGSRQTCAEAAGAAACQCNKDLVCTTAGNICTNAATAMTTCSTDAQGCVYASAPTFCINQTCVSGVCKGKCAPGQKQCSADGVQTCKPDGEWLTVTCGAAICRRNECVPACTAPVKNPADVIPFAIDSVYAAGGYFGDCGVTNYGTADACLPAGGRSSATAKGTCWAITYQPAAPGTPNCGTAGFAGVAWLYPDANFGGRSGYAIPPGATQLSFWARGAAGNEVVAFGTGTEPPPPGTINCGDSFHLGITKTLSTTWAKYVIPLPPDASVGGVVLPFSWVMGRADVVGGKATFYVDDIRWE